MSKAATNKTRNNISGKHTRRDSLRLSQLSCTLSILLLRDTRNLSLLRENVKCVHCRDDLRAYRNMRLSHYTAGMRINGQHYYNGLLSGVEANKFLYNGKELQDQTGYYDYGFRQYEPQLGRWHVIDAMAEKYTSTSPYAYVMNNPVNSVDIMGLLPRQIPYYHQGATYTGTTDLSALSNFDIDNFLDGLGPTHDQVDAYFDSGLWEIMSFGEWSKGSNVSGFYTHDRGGNLYSIYIDGVGRINFGGNVKVKALIKTYKDGANGINWKGFADYLGENGESNSLNWFAEHQSNENVVSGILAAYSYGEYAAEITDGAGSGVYFKVLGIIAFSLDALYKVGVIKNDIDHGNYEHATETGLNIYYNGMMTFGGPLGIFLGGTMLIIDNTIGIDNVIKFQSNFNNVRINQINNGNYSTLFWGWGSVR